MKKFTLAIAALAAASGLHASDQYSFTPKNLDCFYLTEAQYNTFNLDGEDNEAFWANVETVDINTFPSDWGGEPSPLNGDFGAKFKAVYDEYNLYLMIYVTDGTPVWYDGAVGYTAADNVELFFSQAERPAPDGEERDANGSQLRLHPNYTAVPNFVSGGRFAGGLIVDGILSGCEYATKVNDNGYTVEAIIPWDGVIGKENYNITQDATVLFDVSIADCHELGGNRMNILNWSDDTYNGWKYHSRLGNLVLKGDLQAGVNSVEADNSSAAAVYYDIAGRRIANPEKGLYIRLQNGKASKVAL